MKQSRTSRFVGVLTLTAVALLASGACSSEKTSSDGPLDAGAPDAGAPDAVGDTGTQNPSEDASVSNPTGDAGGRDATTTDSSSPSGTEQMISATDGGVITSEDGALTLIFPPGALDEDTVIRLTPLTPAEMSDGWGDLRGEVLAPYDLEPDGLTFNETVGVVFTLDEELLDVGNGLEEVPIWGIASVSGEEDPVVDYAGLTNESPPEGKAQILGGLEHFSQAGVLLWASGLVELDCEGPCETGTTYSGSAIIETRSNRVPARVPETDVIGFSPVSADLSDSSNPFVRPFTYSCQGTGPGKLAVDIFLVERDLTESLALEPGQEGRLIPFGTLVAQDIDCVEGTQCSTDNGDECAEDSDCTTGQSCGSDCTCACVIGEAGAECASNADCNDGTCSNQCACEPEETCATPSVAVDRVATDLGPALANARCFSFLIISVLHSLFTIGLQPVADDHTTLAGAWFLQALLDVRPLFNNSTFPCGDGPAGLTLCQDPDRPVPDEESLVFITSLKGPIPLSDPTNHYQYAFVFDQDGNPDNNYEAPPEYANDFFDGTDRWYEARYEPGSGWSLVVTDATGGDLISVDSNARLIIKDHVMALVVPASEFAASDPSYRVTAFRHTGDYGIDPPHDWDGSLWPAVADGLQATGN